VAKDDRLLQNGHPEGAEALSVPWGSKSALGVLRLPFTKMSIHLSDVLKGIVPFFLSISLVSKLALDAISQFIDFSTGLILMQRKVPSAKGANNREHRATEP